MSDREHMFDWLPEPLWDDSDVAWSSYATRVRGDHSVVPGRFPDFLVIGAPRAGTTWLFENLRRHPDIYLPARKELRYFDAAWKQYPLTWYTAHFADAGARVAGEMSPSYSLLPRCAIELIRDVKPDLKVLFVMRDPAKRAWSHTKHTFVHGEANFRGRQCWFSQVSPRDLVVNALHDFILASSDYGEILRRWLRYFPADQFFLAFSEELWRRPEEMLCEVFRFLGVDPSIDFALLPLKEDVNKGLPDECPPELDRFLRELHGFRTAGLRGFLKNNFGRIPPWPEWNAVGARPPMWLADRRDGWRLYYYAGQFHAVRGVELRESGKTPRDVLEGAEPRRSIRARYLGDLLLKLGPGARRWFRRISESDIEDRRLAAVLDELARGDGEAVVVDEYRGYNIVRAGQRVWAVRKAVGPLDVLREAAAPSGKYSAEDLFMGDSVASVRQHIELMDILAGLRAHVVRVFEIGNNGGHADLASSYRENAERPVLVEEGWGEFNIIHWRARYYALAQAEGEFDPLKALRGEYRRCVAGDSVAEVKRLVSESGSPRSTDRSEFKLGSSGNRVGS